MKTKKQQNNQTTYCGIDICKDFLDVCCLGISKRYINEQKSVSQILKDFSHTSSALHFVYESTGHYSTSLRGWIRKLGVDQSMINPLRSRHFALASGITAKTDKIDAHALVLYAKSMKLPPDQPKLPILDDLQELLNLMNANTARKTEMLNQTKACQNKFALQSLQRSIKACKDEIKSLKAEMCRLIYTEKSLQDRYDLYIAQEGIGICGALNLVILMPELGTFNRDEVASIVGLAPYAYESGKMKGRRSIRGGRRNVRCAMYMCTVSGVRYNKYLKKAYKKARDKGRSYKSAIIECERKWLIYLNSLVKDTLLQKNK